MSPHLSLQRIVSGCAAALLTVIVACKWIFGVTVTPEDIHPNNMDVILAMGIAAAWVVFTLVVIHDRIATRICYAESDVTAQLEQTRRELRNQRHQQIDGETVNVRPLHRFGPPS